MSLKSSIIALAGMVGKCQENSRSLKQCLELGLLEASKSAGIPMDLVKEETGAVDIDLPAEYTELICIITPPSGARLSIAIPAPALGEIATSFATGRHASDSTYQSAVIAVSATKATLSSVVTSGSTVTTTSKLAVYAR